MKKSKEWHHFFKVAESGVAEREEKGSRDTVKANSSAENIIAAMRLATEMAGCGAAGSQP